MQQWHLDVQHDLAHNTVGTLSYVGSKGTHLTRQSDLNQLFPTPLNQNPYASGEAIGPNDCGTTFDALGVPKNATTPSGVPVPYGGLGVLSPAVNLGVGACNTLADPFRPFPGYGTITHLELKSSSIYHALQVRVERDFSNGLQFLLTYTWSKSIDNASATDDSISWLEPLDR